MVTAQSISSVLYIMFHLLYLRFNQKLPLSNCFIDNRSKSTWLLVLGFVVAAWLVTFTIGLFISIKNILSQHSSSAVTEAMDRRAQILQEINAAGSLMAL